MSKSSEPAFPEAPNAPAQPAASAVGLEFPDWSGQIERRGHLTMEEMLRYCEANLPHLRSFPGRKQRRLTERCLREFNLV